MGFHKLNGPFKKLLHILDMLHWGLFNISNNGQMTIPTSIDQVLDSHIVQILTRIDTLKGKLHRSLGIVYFQQDVSLASYTPTQSCTSPMVLLLGTGWYSVVFGEENRFFDFRIIFMCDRDLESDIFYSLFSHGTQAPTLAS